MKLTDLTTTEFWAYWTRLTGLPKPKITQYDDKGNVVNREK